MSVRMHISHSKTASRRSHHRVTVTGITKTATGTRRRHFVDPETGMYRGKQVLPVKKGAAKAAPAKKASAKKAAKAAPAKKSTKAAKSHAHDHTHEHAAAASADKK